MGAARFRDIVMTDIVMAYIVMAYIVMAYKGMLQLPEHVSEKAPERVIA